MLSLDRSGCQVGLNLDFAGVEAFIRARMGKVIDMGVASGAINTFIVEPFVPHEHDQEYYLCIQARRSTDCLFSLSCWYRCEETLFRINALGKAGQFVVQSLRRASAHTDGGLSRTHAGCGVVARVGRHSVQPGKKVSSVSAS